MMTQALNIESNMTLHKMLENKNEVEIPIIQRDYAQGRKNVKEIRVDFLKDIFAHLAENKSMKLSFVYGTKNGSIYVPYDGQQRLTLVYLISLYLSAYSEEWDSIKTLSRFSYYTRDHATAFCNFLTGFESNFDEGLKNVFQRIKIQKVTYLSDAIENDIAFFGAWKYEPTVHSMLVVLQAIHEEFKRASEGTADDIKMAKAKEYLKEIESGKIFFDWCPIQASDNTYIKMNGRGKPLSAYDNFKNTLYSELNKFRKKAAEENKTNQVEFLKDFEVKMDGTWTEMFWEKRNSFSEQETHNIAPFMMNFLFYLFELRHFISSESFFFSGKESFKWIDEKNIVTFLTLFKDLCQDDESEKKGKITIEDYIWISKILDIIAYRQRNAQEDKKLSVDGYDDEDQLFRELAYHRGKVASSRTVIVASLYYGYLVSVSTFDSNGNFSGIDLTYRDAWVRLIGRLIKTAAKFKARYDSLVRDKHILAGYYNLFIPLIFNNNCSGNLIAGAANITQNDLDSLKKYVDTSHVFSQLYEEIIKYQLLHKDYSVWEPLLKEAETDLKYFDNMIYFLISLSKDSYGNYDASLFEKYLNIAQKLFDESGTKEQNKITAILLSFADYRISSGEGYSNSWSLCSNESNEGFSWRSFYDVLEGSIAEQNQKKDVVIKSAFDYIESFGDIDSAYNSLTKKSSHPSWKDVIICYPDVLNEGSKHRIIYNDCGRWYLVRSEGVVKQVHSNSLTDSTDLELFGLFKQSRSNNWLFNNTKIKNISRDDHYIKADKSEYIIKDGSSERKASYDDVLNYMNNV